MGRRKVCVCARDNVRAQLCGRTKDITDLKCYYDILLWWNKLDLGVLPGPR